MNTNINRPRALISRLRQQLRSVLGTLALLFSLGAAPSALATVTMLTFDELGEDAAITSQYTSLGVTVSGANSVTAAVLGFTAVSPPMVAYTPVGIMTFVLNVADVYTVSSYIMGPVDVGLFAYDSSLNLLGQATLPATTDAYTLLSVTSSGNSIARFDIHDGGASFAVDNITFATQSTVPEPGSVWLVGLGLLGLLATTRRKSATTHAG